MILEPKANWQVALYGGLLSVEWLGASLKQYRDISTSTEQWNASYNGRTAKVELSEHPDLQTAVEAIEHALRANSYSGIGQDAKGTVTVEFKTELRPQLSLYMTSEGYIQVGVRITKHQRSDELNDLVDEAEGMLHIFDAEVETAHAQKLAGVLDEMLAGLFGGILGALHKELVDV